MSNPECVFVNHHHSPEQDTFTAQAVAELKAAGAHVWRVPAHREGAASTALRGRAD
jgi:hypothetical protein